MDASMVAYLRNKSDGSMQQCYTSCKDDHAHGVIHVK